MRAALRRPRPRPPRRSARTWTMAMRTCLRHRLRGPCRLAARRRALPACRHILVSPACGQTTPGLSVWLAVQLAQGCLSSCRL